MQSVQQEQELDLSETQITPPEKQIQRIVYETPYKNTNQKQNLLSEESDSLQQFRSPSIEIEDCRKTLKFTPIKIKKQENKLDLSQNRVDHLALFMLLVVIGYLIIQVLTEAKITIKNINI